MRIVLIRPCCIGDVIMATPTLAALRDAYPHAHITWAVGDWSQQAIAHHPAIDALLDTGKRALPVKSALGFVRFVSDLRAGRFDMAISLVRSPLMSAAVWLSGIPIRAGLDSNGRGFGYSHRAVIDPTEARPEAEIYLSVLATLNIDTTGYYLNLPVSTATRADVADIRQTRAINQPYIVIHPGGGRNPGMQMSSKRWLPDYIAQVADALHAAYQAQIILLGAPNDQVILDAVQSHMKQPAIQLAGVLSFPQIGALAAEALVYIGHDSGLTHLAAASGAKTAMILGPSDPRRYAPYVPNALTLWKPVRLNTGGVAQANDEAWDWRRDGITPEEALPQLRAFIEGNHHAN